MVIFTGLTPIAERPTGAGLTLGRGLRAITAEQEDDSQRRRSPAKPDGLGSAVSNLTDEEGILTRGGNLLARWRGREFFSERSLRKQ